MKISSKITLIVAMVGVSFFLGLFIGNHSKPQNTFSYQSTGGPASADLSAVWKAWELLEEKFVPATTTESITQEDHVWGIIEGLADSYDDPYTVFFPPVESKSFEEDIRGSFGGVGIEIGYRNEILTVIAPLKGTPAESAGILSGDYIIEIDGESTQSMIMDEAVEHIRGDVGTVVTFTIARKGEQEFLTIPVTRGIIEVPTLEYELRDDGIFLISLYNFGSMSVNEMRTALRSFVSSGSDKLILDVRGNPGGYLEAAVEIASWFLPLGKVVVIEDFGPNEEKTMHRSKGYDILESTASIAVLIDGGSASASEILAGALNEHGVATLFGTQSFGKGSVQELVDVTENTSLKITIARWLTPNGISLSNNGLKPDYEVAITTEDYQSEKDPQLDAAVAFLLTGATPAATEDTLLEQEEFTEQVDE